jgi:quercetin dioxygenase-like cupin family protein
MIISSIFDNLTFGEDKPALKVLFSTSAAKEVRIVFAKGQEMKAHKTAHPIVVEVVEGNIDFGVLESRHLLTKGMLIALDANVSHDLIAESNSIVRLSVHKNTP